MARAPRFAPPVARRAVLLGTAGVLLGGCGSSPKPTAPASAPSSVPVTPGSPGSPAASSAALPAQTPWQPGPGEIQPEVKLRATQLIEALGTWRAGSQGAAAARTRVAALGLDPALVDQAAPLLKTADADAAVIQVIDAQYGGILATTASVLVVCHQYTQTRDGTVTGDGTTVDVRLSSAQPRWTVTELHPADPGAPAATISAAARQVLAMPAQIQLPPASLADIRSGNVHDSVLDAMLTLAKTYVINVSVVRSGHPIDVFGTTRPSDHPLGKAFDVWRVDNQAVVDPATPHELVDGFMRAAAAAGSYNVGGPRQLSGGSTANQFFSDDTHHDHVHIGFLS